MYCLSRSTASDASCGTAKAIDKQWMGQETPALKLLRIGAEMSNERATTLVPFMQGCSNLRMIESSTEPTPFNSRDKDWASATPIYRSTLEVLTGCRVEVFRGTSFWELAEDAPKETDEVIAKISSFMNSGDSRGYWHTINFTNTNASKLTARAIVDCCQEGLTSLNIARCQGMEIEDLQAILSRANNLRHLECNAPVIDGYAPDPVLLITHLIQSPWACTWLVRLNIHIGGVPRPDIKVNEGGRPVNGGEPLDNCTLEESNTLQLKIYEQLGRLALLEELHLGYAWSRNLGNTEEGYETDKVQRNCLAMTLESGHDILDGLRSLRILGVVNMAHRIEAPELDWMQLNWPDFYSIIGVLFRPYPEDKKRVGHQSTWRNMMRGRA